MNIGAAVIPFAMCSVHRIFTVCILHQSYAESVENCDVVEFLIMSTFIMWSVCP